MSIPAGNVRPHAWSAGTTIAGAGPVDLSPGGANMIYVITAAVISLNAAIVGDSASIRLNGGILAMCAAPLAADGTTVLWAVDKFTGDATIEPSDLLQVFPGGSGPCFWVINGYFWVPEP